MTEKLKLKSLRKTVYLAVYEILGGIAGLIISMQFFLGLSEINFPLKIILFGIMGLYIHSILCGILIFRNEDLGLTHSVINQGFQLISFSSFAISYQYYSGVAIEFTWILTESFWPYVNFGISSWQFFIFGNTSISKLGINIIASLLLFFLLNERKKIKIEKFSEPFSSLGSED